MPGELSKFAVLKRKLYLWVLPLLILAIISSYSDWDWDFSAFDVISGILVLWFFSAWILLYKKTAIRLVEIVTLGVSSVTHLITTFYTLNWIVQEQQDTIGSSSYWTTLIYIYIFVTLKGRTGAIYSFLLWLATFSLVIVFWPNLSSEFKDNFLQYMLANLVYISFLFASLRIMRTYTESELLEKMAYHDSLTGIANRRQLHNWMDQIMQKQPEHLSVIFFDIDHFKRINDQFGHLAGDQVLVEFTTIINEHLNSSDYFGRWGGEEFVVITLQPLPDAIELAESLRKVVSEHCFTKVGNVTSSFGVDSLRPGEHPNSLFDRADTALYLAKQESRNTVKFYNTQK
ncbi:GGDEF domain-containing protein [Bacillus sp. BGMRC 2118]|nr:GGDEF domain-containing protein [Bacillus sp. BGMRC 2118]